MEEDEKIHAHIVSVWREAKGFFTIGGKEGMLFLTDNHLMFVSKLKEQNIGGSQLLKDKILLF